MLPECLIALIPHHSASSYHSVLLNMTLIVLLSVYSTINVMDGQQVREAISKTAQTITVLFFLKYNFISIFLKITPLMCLFFDYCCSSYLLLLAVSCTASSGGAAE